MRGFVISIAAMAMSTTAWAEDPGDSLRAVYSQGYWDGYAAAQANGRAPGARRSRSAFGMSAAGAGAPIWVVPAEESAAPVLEVPGMFLGEGVGAVEAVKLEGYYFKGPWVWHGAGLEGLVRRTEGGTGFDVEKLRGLDTVESPPDAAASDQIRRIRAMGINEGFVITRALPAE